MDKTKYTYICSNCGHEETALFYDYDFYSFDTGDIMGENLSRERAITKKPCKKCGKTGFFERKDLRKKNNEK